MKRFLSFLAAASLLVGFTACSDSDPDPLPEDPKFPEAVTVSVGVGADEGYTLLVKGNLDWKVALVADNDACFVLSDDGGTTESAVISGNANEEKSITVYSVNEELFDGGHTCQLVMTMNTETQTIAYISQGTVERTFTLYAAIYDAESGEYTYDEEGQLVYDEVDPETAVELYWLGSWYQRPIAIAANFNWKESLPEWMQELANTNTDAETGLFTAWLRTVEEKTEEPTGVLTFTDADNAEAAFAYEVTIPNYGAIFDMVPAGETEFDAEGSWNSNGSWIPEGGPKAYISTPEGYEVYAYTKVNQDSGAYYTTENADWITVDTEDITDNANALVHDVTLKVTVAANDTYSTREGLVLVLPAYYIEELKEAYAEDEDFQIPFDLSEESLSDIEAYIFTTISQAGAEKPSVEDPEILTPADPAGFGEYAFFSSIEKNSFFPGAANLPYYKLVYNHEWGYDEAYLDIAEEYQGDVTFAFYDCDGEPFDEVDEFNGLSVLGTITDTFRISMDGDNAKWRGVDYAHEGFVIVSHAGVPFVGIYCIFDADYTDDGGNGGGNDQPTGGYTASWSYPSLVNESDAMLVNIETDFTTYGPIFGINEVQYQNYKSAGIPMYGVAYMIENPMNTMISLKGGFNPETATIMTAQEDWLNIEAGSDYIMLNMDKTAANGETTAAVYVYDADFDLKCAIFFAYLGE